MGVSVIAMALTLAWLSDEELKLVDYARQGYLHNLEAFKNLDCAYTVSLGSSDAEDGLRGRMTTSTVMKGTLRFTQGRYLHRMEGDPSLFARASAEARAKKQATFTAPAGAESFQMMRDETLFLTVSGMINGGNIGEIDKHGFTSATTPFSYAMFDSFEPNKPAVFLEGCRLGRCKLLHAMHREKEGEIEIALADEHATRFTFVFDVNRGFLASVMRLEGANGHICEARLLEAASCSGNRWFPLRIANVSFPRGQSQNVDARLIVVTSLNPDDPPPESAFEVQVPPKTRVCYLGIPAARFDSPGETIRLGQLKDVLTRCLAASGADASTPWGYVWPLALGGAVLSAAALGFGLWRRRRRQALSF